MAQHDGVGDTFQAQRAKARSGGVSTGAKPQDSLAQGTHAGGPVTPRRLTGALLGKRAFPPSPGLRNEKGRLYEPR